MNVPRRAWCWSLVPILVVLAGCTLLPGRADPSGTSTGPAPSVSASAGPVTPSGSLGLPAPAPAPTARPTRAASSGPSGPRTTAAGPPRTYADARARIDAALARPSELSSFTTPSGNLYCALSGVEPGCELKEGRVAPPAGYCGPAGGGAQDIGRVIFQRGTPTPICNSDTIVSPGAATLSYGSTAGAGSIQCLSESIGVTCVDTDSERGFFLARGQYVLY